MNDAFSKYHPAVNFLFFAGAVGCGVVIRHPAYVLTGIVTGAVYYLLLNGRAGWKMILGLVPLFLFLTAINPLLNTEGVTPLFWLFGRPYALEAMAYGAAVAAVFVVMMLWFGCCNKVLTGDKFTSLFGNLIPAISLLLVMVFRMVPSLLGKATQIMNARRAVGKGTGESASSIEKRNDMLPVLGVLVCWALEGSVVTADSMRARGYGTVKRSSFRIYRMSLNDWLLIAAMVVLLALIVMAGCLGQMVAVFTPEFQIAPISLWLVPYTAYLLIPTALYTKEAILWHITRSKI